MPASGTSDASALPSISVVAPTYNRLRGLPAFVEPLLAEPELHELVMAVDGSPDASADWLEERARSDPRLKVLRLPNRGVPPTRQAGIEAATGDVVLLMDDDVIAEPGLVARHRAHHAALEPKLVLGYMPNEWEHLPPGRRAIGRIYRRAYEAHVARFAEDPEFVLQGLWGGNLSMPRRDFLRVGIIGVDVTRGQDDREFGMRCLKAGIRGVFDPSLRARHLYDRPLQSFRRDMRIQGESRKLIHVAHEDLVGAELVSRPKGSEVVDVVGLGLPPFLRPLLPSLARDPLFGVLTGILTVVFHAAVRARLLEVEAFAARGIGSLETMRGVLDRS